MKHTDLTTQAYPFGTNSEYQEQMGWNTDKLEINWVLVYWMNFGQKHLKYLHFQSIYKPLNIYNGTPIKVKYKVARITTVICGHSVKS